MKAIRFFKFVFLIVLLWLPSLLLSQTVEPDQPVNVWRIIWTIVVPIIAGLYEVIVRIIPTVGNYSFIGKIIEILLWISNFLNNKKKK
jgi:hypothetical protein